MHSPDSQGAAADSRAGRGSDESRTSLRLALEWIARLVALAIVASLLAGSLRAPRHARTVAEGTLTREALSRWTSAGAPARLHLRLTSSPDPVERAWASALSRAGTGLTWSGDDLRPTALSAEARVDPRGGVRVQAIASGARAIALADEAGHVDSIALRDGAGSVILAGAVGVLDADAGDRSARIALPERIEPRAVLVLGAAGWESRFIIAALEERGWRVAAQLGIAPDVAVTQGAASSPDTGIHSAVVAVDSTAASEAAAIARFVRRGGGLVIVGSAATIPALRAIAPAAPGPYLAPGPGNPPDSSPRTALGARPLVGLVSDAVPLERRGARVMAAARRVGAGRVVQLAYDDSWRWRMGAGEGAVEAHRDWWSKVVSGVAYTPVVVSPAAAVADSIDAAPFPRLVAALGAASEAPPPSVEAAGVSPWWALLVLLVLLLGEWSSRRLRGAR